MAYHFSPRIVRDGLIMYYDYTNNKSYTSGSTVLTDISNNGYNGTINGVTYSNGVMSFDGNDYIINTPILPLQLSIWTVSMWIKPTSVANPYQELLGGQYSSTTGTLYLIVNGITTVKMDIYSNADHIGTTPLQINNWYYLTYSCDGTNTYYYINGVLDITIPSFAVKIIGTNFTIGKNPNGASEFYIGLMNLVKYYNRCLSQTEITQNFNALRGRFGV